MGFPTPPPMAHDQSLPTASETSIVAYSQDIETKLRFCRMVLTSGLVPTRYKNEQSVLTAILMGQELGFPPLTALRMIHVINGTPTLSAAGMKAKALQAGIQLKTEHWDAQRCRIAGKRPGWEHWEYAEFTIEDARKADLLKNPTWNKHPRAMLHARAVSMLLKTIATDIIEGMQATEELIDEDLEGVQKTHNIHTTVATPGSISGSSWSRIDVDDLAAQSLFVDKNTGEILPAETPHVIGSAGGLHGSKEVDDDDLPDDFTA